MRPSLAAVTLALTVLSGCAADPSEESTQPTLDNATNETPTPIATPTPPNEPAAPPPPEPPAMPSSAPEPAPAPSPAPQPPPAYPYGG